MSWCVGVVSKVVTDVLLVLTVLDVLAMVLHWLLVTNVVTSS